MNCAICKRPGIWSPRYGAILCNAHKHEAERGTVITLASGNIVILSIARNDQADAIRWLRQYKQRKKPGTGPGLTPISSQERSMYNVFSDCTTE